MPAQSGVWAKFLAGSGSQIPCARLQMTGALASDRRELRTRFAGREGRGSEQLEANILVDMRLDQAEMPRSATPPSNVAARTAKKNPPFHPSVPSVGWIRT